MNHPAELARPFRALLVYPAFTSQSFWNYRATCELIGASYPAVPLGLLTVAALLPAEWEIRLLDKNVEEWDPSLLDWADLVLSGGMVSQQIDHVALIDEVHAHGGRIVVGGIDPTSNPHIYDRADHLVLNEAEVTLPRFLADLRSGGAPSHVYTTPEHADVTSTPPPRYDLIDTDNYLHVGVQFTRGCPFNCEFCDVIEIYGRRSRVKSADQILTELQNLYELGYRGHVDFVDDNFIGDKRAVKELLPRIARWLKEHGHPFEFSTEASLNLARDDELLRLMQEANFSIIFVGIESPDVNTLRQTGKVLNTKGSIVDHCRKIYRHGMLINAGFIIGFDSESGNVAEGIKRCVEDSAIAVVMAGLLAALPNTQLTRRLRREGRLPEELDLGKSTAREGQGDQCNGGLNFVPVRSRVEVLRDYRRTIAALYERKSYFRRARAAIAQLRQGGKKLRLTWHYQKKAVRALWRSMIRQGFRTDYRRQYWLTVLHALFRNPRSFSYAIALCALYAHFGPYSRYLVGELDRQIAEEVANPSLSYEEVVAAREKSVAPAPEAGTRVPHRHVLS